MPSEKSCKIENCKRPYRAKGYCDFHFKKWRRGEMPKKPRYKTCKEENCRKPMVRWGLCEEHYKALVAAKKGQAAEAAAPAPAPAPEKPIEKTNGLI